MVGSPGKLYFDAPALACKNQLQVGQERRRLPANLIAEIDHLLDQHSPHEIAPILNAQGLHSIDGRPFNGDRVYAIACRHGLTSRHDRMRATGLLTITEMAQLLKISESEVWRRRRRGLLRGQAFGVNRYLYQRPGSALGKQLNDGVQCEA